jgi:hypothetical protein
MFCVLDPEAIALRGRWLSLSAATTALGLLIITIDDA